MAADPCSSSPIALPQVPAKVPGTLAGWRSLRGRLRAPQNVVPEDTDPEGHSQTQLLHDPARMTGTIAGPADPPIWACGASSAQAKP